MRVPKYIRVLKNGPRYYSSFIKGRQYIYSFIHDEPLRNCAEFISEYKRYYKKYPPIDNLLLRRQTRREKYDNVHVEVADTEVLQRHCLMYNVGLVAIEKFEYSFGNGLFDVDISADSILPHINIKERKNLLNYALLLNGPFDNDSK
jgi:hypothetical protein